MNKGGKDDSVYGGIVSKLNIEENIRTITLDIAYTNGTMKVVFDNYVKFENLLELIKYPIKEIVVGDKDGDHYFLFRLIDGEDCPVIVAPKATRYLNGIKL